MRCCILLELSDKYAGQYNKTFEGRVTTRTSINMSITNIPDKTKYKLWGRSAGRCQYCNKPLWEDLFTKTQFSTAYIAHIIGEKPNSARYVPILSEELSADFSNLMLLCDEHHRLIDIEDVEGHSVEKLKEIKRNHEERIRIQTELSEDKQSHIIHYGTNIGRLKPFVTWSQSKDAMSPTHYPAESNAIELNLINSQFEDFKSEFWLVERDNLHMQFGVKIQPRLGKDVKHLSVFAIAPQPLMIELGRLLSDVTQITVYQHQKEPQDSWRWEKATMPVDYLVERPSTTSGLIALNLSLSANIANSRITHILGNDVSIWTLTIAKPHNDFLKSQSQLQAFREAFRKLLNEIKLAHGQQQIIHLFPAVPNSIAIEIGRVWMPKADLPLQIYDQNSRLKGFVESLTIHND